MSDLLRQFFGRYKENDAYKYVDLIDSHIIQSKIIEIDYHDFPDEIKIMLQNQPKERIHIAIYRAIAEVFQIRHGSENLESIKQDDSIKFKVNNFEFLEYQIYSNPNLVHSEFETRLIKTVDEACDYLLGKYFFKTLQDTKEILYYKNGAYVEGGETIIGLECEKIFNDCTNHLENEVKGKIKRKTPCDRKDFDKENNFINAANTRLNLRTNQWGAYSPNYLIRRKLNVRYDPHAKCPAILNFLRDCLPNGKDLVNVLEHVASILIDLKLEKAYMYIGEGANGKSTFFELLRCFIGDDNISSISIHDLIHHRFAKAGLDGKIANIFSEIQRQEIKELSTFKMIVSGDIQEAEKKGKDRFKFKPIARHFFSANRLPELEDETDAVFRRFDLVEWTQQFTDTFDPKQIETDSGTYKADPRLIEKITTPEELSGFLNILIPIAKKLEKRKKLLFAKTIDEMKRVWREKSDSTARFSMQCLEANSNWVMLRSDVLIAYYQWCKNIGKTIPDAERNFYKKLQISMPIKYVRTSKYISNKSEKFQYVEGIQFNLDTGLSKGQNISKESSKPTISKLSDVFDN